MFWASKVLAPAVLILGLAGAVSVLAAPDGNQPPFGKGQFGKGGDDKKKDEVKGDEKKKDDKKADDKKGAAPKPDATVDAWVKTLLEKITDPHDTVRESARGAVVAVGPAAMPALQKLAEGDDAAKVVAARKLMHAIAATHGGPGQPGMPGGNRMGGGFPGGMGPMGPGFPGGGGGMNPGGRGGPGGQPGMAPGGGGGPRRPGGEEGGREVAPMPRAGR